MAGLIEFVHKDKNSFSQKCSMLSQYLKENNTFGDLPLGIKCSAGASTPTVKTMDLFPISEKQEPPVSSNTIPARNTFRSMDLFPQQSGFDTSVNKQSVNSQPQNSQLTIFYNGQVIVFNDFPADKAKEVMLLAGSNGNSVNGFPSVPVNSNPSPVFSTNVVKPCVESSTSVPSTPTSVPSFSPSLIQERIQTPPQPIASDLPIARRASLHRFLEKRKDRITARAPYQTSGLSADSSKKPVVPDNKSWLGLAAQSSK